MSPQAFTCHSYSRDETDRRSVQETSWTGLPLDLRGFAGYYREDLAVAVCAATDLNTTNEDQVKEWHCTRTVKAEARRKGHCRADDWQ